MVSLDSYQEALSAFEAENRLLGKSSVYPLAEVCWEITQAGKTDSEVIRFLNRLLSIEADAAMCSQPGHGILLLVFAI